MVHFPTQEQSFPIIQMHISKRTKKNTPQLIIASLARFATVARALVGSLASWSVDWQRLLTSLLLACAAPLINSLTGKTFILTRNNF